MKYIRRFFAAFIFIGTLIAIGTIFYLWNYQPEPERSADQETEKRAISGELRHKAFDKNKQHAVSHGKKRLPNQRRKIAIIIDDIGEDLKPLSALLDMDVPLTFAILPYCTHSENAADMIYKAGREILLHLPMEPYDNPGKNPGRGALFVHMSAKEIRNQLDENMRAVPHICGVNNHMGSRFMEDGEKLTVVFEELKKRGLFFVDSRTTPASKAKELAVKMNIPFAERKAFIDNDNHYPIIFEKIMEILNNPPMGNGENIVLIGHPYPDTVRALRKAVPLMRKEGDEIITLTKLIQLNNRMISKQLNERNDELYEIP
ncbi:MAG: divergent polysaccharide deacetylase family protein [Deltaproteobacteria bacterium]|nr:divergent polysaccharide deacetylase family protein [Deltaproteobacteria bacterium]